MNEEDEKNHKGMTPKSSKGSKSISLQHIREYSLSKMSNLFISPQSKKSVGQTKYQENWYQEVQVVFPKLNYLDKVKSKQEIFRFRKNGSDPTRLKSSVHGFKRKVNCDKYFGVDIQLQNGHYVRKSEDEVAKDKNEKQDGSQMEEGAQEKKDDGNLKLPPIDGNLRSLSLNQGTEKLKSQVSMLEDEGEEQIWKKKKKKAYRLSFGSLDDITQQEQSVQFENISDYKIYLDEAEANEQALIKKEKEIKHKLKKQQMKKLNNPLDDSVNNSSNLNSVDMQDNLSQNTSVQQQSASTDQSDQQDQLEDIFKYKNLFNTLKETETRLTTLIFQNQKIKYYFDGLLTIRIQDISSLMIKFFKYCIEQMFNSFNNASKQRVLSIDPKVLKSLFITVAVVPLFENFFIRELERSELTKQSQKNAFKKIWKRQCLNNILADNLLLELGGVRRIESVIASIQITIQRHFQMKFHKNSKEQLVLLALGLFQENSIFTSSIVQDFKEKWSEQSTLKQKQEDLFTLKHFVFLELLKEEYISWEHKIIILNKLERLRFEHFRELYRLSDSKDVATLIEQIAPALLQNELPYKKQNEISSFFEQVEQSMLGKGSPDQLIQIMKRDKIDPNLNFVLTLEQLMKNSLMISKDAPILLKKVIEHKFAVLKRSLKLLTSFYSIELKMNDIMLQMNVMIATILKHTKIPQEEYANFFNLSLFTQILVECCSQLDTFSIYDIIYGQEFYNIQKKHFLLWVKCLKRVLLEMKFSAGEVKNLSVFLVKIFEDAQV